MTDASAPGPDAGTDPLVSGPAGSGGDIEGGGISGGTSGGPGGHASQSPDLLADLGRLLLDDATLVRAVAGGRRRTGTVPWRRVELRYVDVAAGRRLQVTSYDDTQAHVRNVETGSPQQAVVGELLGLPFGHWHVETVDETVQLRFSKKGRALLHRTARTSPAPVDRRHDRSKRRRLDPADPLFALLGITGADGSVKPSRRAKHRQVEDFLGALDAVIDDALARRDSGPVSDTDPLRLVDLGCGNAYLTFGAYRYLTEARGLPVEAIGVDVKAQARERNARLAHELGAGDRLRFLEGTIAGADVGGRPDLVVALHACDTATDEALAWAVRRRAPVVLAAPCCHHDIQAQLSSASLPEASRLLVRSGILRERFGDVLTDALRAAVLRLAGYRVEVVEFVDPEHTPRNTLIRAIRTDAPAGDSLLQAYADLTGQWRVTPALQRMLAADVPALARVPAGCDG